MVRRNTSDWPGLFTFRFRAEFRTSVSLSSASRPRLSHRSAIADILGQSGSAFSKRSRRLQPDWPPYFPIPEQGQRAIPGNGLRREWHIWQCRQRRICKLQTLLIARQFRPPPPAPPGINRLAGITTWRQQQSRLSGLLRYAPLQSVAMI